jgi:CheY-like chemotaxis protein
MSINVLIIDDDEFNLEVLGRLLKAEGANHIALQDATKIEDALAELPRVDIVFLDLEMPKMDGYQAFALLREKLGDHVPIIACTVHLNEIDEARNLGFAGFLGKPIDQKRFGHQYQAILNGQGVWEI